MTQIDRGDTKMDSRLDKYIWRLKKMESKDFKNQVLNSTKESKNYIIDQLFKPKTIFGNRNSKYFHGFRINRKGELESFDIYFSDTIWLKSSWEDYFKSLNSFLRNEEEIKKENDFFSYRWSPLIERLEKLQNKPNK